MQKVNLIYRDKKVTKYTWFLKKRINFRALFVPHQKMYVGSLRVSLRLTSLVPLSWSRVTWERLIFTALLQGPCNS